MYYLLRTWARKGYATHLSLYTGVGEGKGRTDETGKVIISGVLGETFLT